MHPKDAPLKPVDGARVVPVTRQHQGRRFEAHDCVAEEVPVALEYNGVSHVVMLASPTELEDFALGFSVTEGVVDTIGEVHDIEVTRSAQGITVHLTIAASRFAALKQRRRNLAGRTGCGLCGAESLAQAVRQPTPVGGEARFSAVALVRALHALRGRQLLHEATGATHAAAFSRADGSLLLVREDVGRHNALDKLVGALLRSGEPVDAGFVVVTSRASYEMVGKTARAGVALLAAVSGVTSLAVDTAQQSGVALAGFARGDDLSLYAHAQRMVWNDGH